jgi:hypothetical protein
MAAIVMGGGCGSFLMMMAGDGAKIAGAAGHVLYSPYRGTERRVKKQNRQQAEASGENSR